MTQNEKRGPENILDLQFFFFCFGSSCNPKVASVNIYKSLLLVRASSFFIRIESFFERINRT